MELTMRKRKIMIPFFIGICIISLVYYTFRDYIILPINSYRHTLTLLQWNYYTGSLQSVILEHYINNELVKSYELKLNKALEPQVPQEYEIPKLTEGKVKVIAEYENRCFDVEYQEAYQIYKNGLLIRNEADHSSATEIDGIVDLNYYVYFKSGKNQTVFSHKVGEVEWMKDNKPPKLKRFVCEEIGYYPVYTGWKEKNKWVMQ